MILLAFYASIVIYAGIEQIIDKKGDEDEN